MIALATGIADNFEQSRTYLVALWRYIARCMTNQRLVQEPWRAWQKSDRGAQATCLPHLQVPRG